MATVYLPVTARLNLTSDPYFTDGLRVVVMLSTGKMVPAEEVDFLEWLNSADPMARP